MAKNFDVKLILEDGSEFFGLSFGAKKETVVEVVFNTSMVGYQEIVSDPSYTYQGVVMTYPLIGNYGMAEDDYESKNPSIGALIVAEYNDEPSNFRATETLSSVMERFSIPGVSGIDTRKLTRIIRDKGSMRAIITDAKTTREEGLKKIAASPVKSDAVEKVSLKKIREAKAENEKFRVAAIDCGMKENIVRSLNARGCSVRVFPYDTTAEKIKEYAPDGLFLSNGPGDPEDVTPVIKLVKELKGTLPIFGICLGHQMIALVYGAKTYKLKFGHRGANHPVKNLKTGRIEITSQNHSYAVDEASLKGTGLTVTHVNLLDKTVEGIECEKDKVFSVQYHPESSAGPEDSKYLFNKFIKLLESKNA